VAASEYDDIAGKQQIHFQKSAQTTRFLNRNSRQCMKTMADLSQAPIPMAIGRLAYVLITAALYVNNTTAEESLLGIPRLCVLLERVCRILQAPILR
jgi:hypothetical protein